jgi:hypothetical protein
LDCGITANRIVNEQLYENIIVEKIDIRLRKVKRTTGSICNYDVAAGCPAGRNRVGIDRMDADRADKYSYCDQKKSHFYISHY